MFGLVPWLKVYSGLEISDAVVRGFELAALPAGGLALVVALVTARMARGWNRSEEMPTITAFPPPAPHAMVQSQQDLRAMYGRPVKQS
jgi:hypothetical protein